MNIRLIVTLLGTFALGIFVGVVLALGIRDRVVQLRVVKFALGAALAGVPIAFMRGLQFEKWMYPLGLLFGLSLLRMIAARDAITMEHEPTTGAQ